ncbi:MAG TPA: hypothetical protein VFF41_08055 [Gallionella sp.]|nr:hypothetical protein [Gallionella sp.]
MKYSKLFALCSLFFLITGCATEPTNLVFYTAPALEADSLAIVSGSEKHRAIFDNQTTYLVAIDGLPIAHARASFANQIKVKSGNRKLTVAYAQGSFFGITELSVDLKADHSYILESAPTSGEDGSLTDASVPYAFWVADSSTSEAIGEKKFAKVSAPSGGYIPIFIK